MSLQAWNVKSYSIFVFFSTQDQDQASFKDLRTVVLENGEIKVCTTYHEDAFHMGLVQDDKEWEIALDEASVVAMPAQIRSLFVIILTHGLPQNPQVLWEKYRDCMSEDFRHKRTSRRYDTSADREFIDDDYNALCWTFNLNCRHFRNQKQKITVFHQQENPLHASM